MLYTSHSPYRLSLSVWGYGREFSEMFRKKDEANAILRYLVSVSQGYQFTAPVRVRFSILLRLKDDLERLGAKWQVARANNWINRFIKEHKDALQDPEILITPKSRGVSKKPFSLQDNLTYLGGV